MKFTDARILNSCQDQIREYRSKGYNYQQIADALGVSKQSVDKHINGYYIERAKKYNLPKKKHERVWMTQAESRRFSGPFYKVSRYHDTFKSYVEAGWTTHQIARAFDVSEDYVRGYVTSEPGEFPGGLVS